MPAGGPSRSGCKTSQQAHREEIVVWCRGRSPLIRGPLVIGMAYVGIRHFFDPYYTSLIGPLNLAIHEGGHLLFSWLSWTFLTVAAGTLLQLAAPIGAAVMFVRQPDWFAVSFSGSWLATNLYNVATYVADARAMDLPLVTVGDGQGVDHDWNYMLSTLQLLQWDTAIGALFRLLAFVVMWGSIAAGAWILWLMAHSPEAER